MSERNEVFHAIQVALAGRTEGDVLSALIASLVVAIGVGAEDMFHACKVIDDLPAEMKVTLRREWPKMRRHRTVAALKHAVERAADGH